MRGTGGFNPQGLAADVFGGSQALTDPKPRQTLTQQLIQGAHSFGNTASSWGMSALNTLRQVNDPATVQRALAFYDNQVSQGQQQGGLGGFFQQALGLSGRRTRLIATKSVVSLTTAIPNSKFLELETLDLSFKLSSIEGA
jgi:hypothetical protein